MERLTIDLIQQCSTVTRPCRIARSTWDEAWGIMSRAVARGRARKLAQPIPYIGVNETAFRKGHRGALPVGPKRAERFLIAHARPTLRFNACRLANDSA